MRLIDADALYDVMMRLNIKENRGITRSEYKLIDSVLYEFPTIDAEPVRRGKWIRTGRSNIYGGTELECNLCKDRVMVQDVGREHYCRNCGAKMEDDDETD